MKQIPNTVPIAIDLFAGAGGLAEGLESAGIRVAVAVELHPQAALTHSFNHPHTKVLVGDIRALSLDLLAERVKLSTGRQKVDLVVGGPPCQGFSTAGKKIFSDPRNDLFLQFVRVVKRFRPRMFLLENVPGFKKMHQGRAFANASTLFTELGYKLADMVLGAASYGVPQRRQRFVMVGWLPDKAAPFSWPEPTHSASIQRSLFSSDILPFVSVGESLEDIAFLEPGWESHQYQMPAQSDFQIARRNGCEFLFNHLATRHRPKAIKMFSYISEGATIASVPPQYRSGKRTMARLDRHSISNAVLAMPDDLIHYQHNRIPTVREMARLQSFDDDYVFIGKRTSGFIERRVDVPQYTQVGNAVPPLLGRALGLAILSSLEGERQDIRDLAQRRSRHQWIRGSSGYAGYTLDPLADAEIDIETIQGERLSLPISEDCPVAESQAIYDWTIRLNPKRGQWAPGVTPRSTPSHALEVGE